MRLLLDENIDIRLAAELTAAGHDVTTVVRDYSPGISDREILTIVVQEGRTLVTKDRDFSALVVREGLSHAGILYLRMRGSFAIQRDRVTSVIATYRDRMPALLTVTEGSVRVLGSGTPAEDSTD